MEYSFRAGLFTFNTHEMSVFNEEIIDLMSIEKKGDKMKKKGRKYNRKWLLALSLVVVTLILGYFFMSRNKLKASTVVTSGDFRLTAENKWSQKDRKNYAALKWDKINDLSQSGYQLYQSEDGKTWNNRSLNYGKPIKVLNLYPDQIRSNTLKGWMDSLNLKASDGSNLIQVTPVTLSDYNANPNAYLKDDAGVYQYDVLMFGSWDTNNAKDISKNAAEETITYLDTGRGVLFGHDTVSDYSTRAEFYSHFKDLLGVGRRQTNSMTGSAEVRLINNGYLMKFPFELENDVVLNIPYAHNVELQDTTVGTTWLEFINPTAPWPNPILVDGNWRGGWYLKTNNNVGMIQTGHSQGNSNLDERKIIANTLYNLAQVSLDNFANDQTVKDDQAPNKPNTNISCGKGGNFNIEIDASDEGKEYQWYIEAHTKSSGKKKSDIVKEVIVSNIEGYFYEVTNSPKSNLKEKVEGYKDSYGRIDPEKYDLYVAPNEDSVEYDTKSTFSIQESKNSEKYLHVLAVDRASNISSVNSQRIKDLNRNIDFNVERTENEVKLIELNLDNTLNKKMDSLEIRIPKNTVIKDFSSLVLPEKWTVKEGNTETEYNDFTFAIKENNDLLVITNFINQLRFSINDPVDQKGEIKIVFYEKDKNEASSSKVTNVCWAEDIPQKVILKAYDEMNNAIPSADILLDQKLTIAKTESITPKKMEFYDFVKLVSTEGNQITPVEWTITNEVQEGHLIYRLRKLTVHSRQVVNNANNQVVVPKRGFGTLTSGNTLGEKKDEFSLNMNSTVDNGSAFDTYIIRYQIKEPLYTFISKIPMNYELIGYVLTTDKGQHLSSNSSQTPIQVDVSKNPEFWLTTYIKPVTLQPTFHHWEYKENKLGTIQNE
ncbi:hypothetical protein [Enterococcus caccae]|uniref:DUF5057 domain-containing protein n=1 Tax=Enterococcus caccae ATCC BAA-1240 TaxID=1158612 RepID=R3WIN6_9ENTE|nr:hypothetical protein [Enterococcus caccae]EOL47711.1 hypothetical protein UC7_00961 [Enterococcus caccae ATCC BAA-1240]EOT65509.1 hypothetical protein I580_01265 [Enterococcus caccae ATCC BAA-1240]OJG27310.1 hypothetical protein RU98_GL002762 [Enterococcus caccae]